MGFMERRSIDQIKERFSDLYRRVLITNWQVWPIAQVRCTTPQSSLYT
jgi:protein Mpv17